MRYLRPTLVLLLLFTLLLGVLYPAAIAGIGAVAFPDKAHGSLIYRNASLIGSSLIGQSFTSATYFWPRPTEPEENPYLFLGSGPSNLGPARRALIDRVRTDMAHLGSAHLRQESIPDDLVTTSGSGLDPHISPAAAHYQIARIAKARNMDKAVLEKLVAAQTEAPTFGLLGQPRVNVLSLNLALDDLGTGAPP
ncbi:MAG: potassium-transporting ATPase subunit KdpC [Alphaproteobacteria bacterium]|nr:potassium-transporting ATPase subunit KdpC [Alphaproteobacteria bacterium]